MLDLTFNQIGPFIRYAQILSIKSKEEFSFLKAYDCRFFYCLEGEGSIWIEDVSYNMKKGSLLLWQPNLRYHLISQKQNSMKMIGFNFDFTGKHSNKNTPIPPDKWDQFDERNIIEQVHFFDLPTFNRPVYLKNMLELEDTLLDIKNEYNNKKRFYEQRTSGLFLNALVMIARIAATTSQNEKSNKLVDEIISYIHEHYPEQLSNTLIGEIFNYHPNYINRLMVLHTGCSLYQYILNHRISKALQLIQTTNLPISEVGKMVGFHDFPHFSKCFKNKIGRSPTDFKHIHGQ